MKILILKNQITVNIDDDIEKVKDYFAKHDIKLDFTFKEIKENFKSIFAPTTAGGQQYVLDKNDATPKVLKYLNDCDIVILALNGDQFGITRPSGAMHGIIRYVPQTAFININCDSVDDAMNNTYLQMCHEIMHTLILFANMKGAKIVDPMDVYIKDGVIYRYYKNDNPDAPDGNFAEAWSKLQVPATTKSKYKYFTQQEVDTFQLVPQLWELLDKMRADCGFPFVIESGKRTKEQNDKLADAVPDSAHLDALAVDIKILDSVKRLKLTQVAFKYGITRLGIGKNFIHLDIDKTKPQNVLWTYYK